MSKRLGNVCMLGLLLVLAVRLCINETLYNAPVGVLTAIVGGAAEGPGSATTVGLAVLTLALAAGAAFAMRPRPWQWGQLALVAAVVGLCAASAFHANNRYLAIVSTLDVAMALIAGWAAGLLCTTASRRRWVAAAVVAVLTAWVVNGAVQYFVDNPDTLRQLDEKRAQLPPAVRNSPEMQLFEARARSGEITGFVALSNVLAEGLSGAMLLALGAAVAAFTTSATRARVHSEHAAREPAPRMPRKGARRADAEVPVQPLLGAALVVLLAGAAWVMFHTDSNGGMAATALAVLAFLALYAGRRFVAEHRRALLAAALVAVACGAACVLIYGTSRGTLPSKSLRFRWQYWSGAAHMIAARPGLGVGLANFGQYYPEVKPPEGPEEVKDPHNIFVRYASEAGVPAAVLVVGLLVLLLWRSVRPMRGAAALPEPRPIGPVVLAGAAFCVCWWGIRYWLADAPLAAQDPRATTYLVEMDVLYALAGLVGWTIAGGVLAELSERGRRLVLLAGVAGTLAMLLYDQVNMALVTGPVAMLFWMMLGTAAAGDESAEGGAAASTAERPSVGSWLAGGGVLAAAGVTAGLLWMPLLGGTFAWDPQPYVARARQLAAQNDLPGALAAANRAIELDPRNVRNLRMRIDLQHRLGQGDIADIRRVLELSKNDDALLHEQMGMLPELSVAERKAALERALWLDDQLAPDEPKRLSAEQRAKIQGEIEALGS